MNVQALVTNAIYKSLQDRQHQSQINAGYEEFALFELNNVLDDLKDWIPFSSKFTFNNVDELTATLFVSVSNVNFVLNTTQMPLKEESLTRFNEIQSILGLNGIPQIYYFNELSQSILVYPTPSNPTYQFTVWGRRAQQPLILTDLLPENMPRFMIDSITFELAWRVCCEYGVPWSDNKEKERQRLLTNLMTKRDLDLSPRREIVFRRPRGGVPPFPYFYYLSGGGQ